MGRYTNSRNLHLHRCPTYRTYLAVDNEMLPAFAHLESKRIILILALSHFTDCKCATLVRKGEPACENCDKSQYRFMIYYPCRYV